MVDRIKVLLAYGSPAWREPLRNLILGQVDMTVVGEASDPVDLLLVANETQADVVVMFQQQLEEDPGICSHLLSECPRLLILAFSTAPEKVVLYRQAVVKEDIYPVSDDVILQTIRQWT